MKSLDGSITLSNRIQYPRGPPMIITQLINLAFMGSVKHSEVLLFPSTCDDGPEGFCWGQTYLQKFLLFAAMCSMPVLLLAKPFILKAEYEASNSPSSEGYGSLGDGNGNWNGDLEPSPTGTGERDLEGQSLMGENGEEEEEFEFAEIFIHQIIHTIEY